MFKFVFFIFDVNNASSHYKWSTKLLMMSRLIGDTELTILCNLIKIQIFTIAQSAEKSDNNQLRNWFVPSE